jgi:hypothetical protein
MTPGRTPAEACMDPRLRGLDAAYTATSVGIFACALGLRQATGSGVGALEGIRR